MTGLLAAYRIAVLKHIFKNITVADLGCNVVYAGFVAILVEAHIGHDGNDRRVLFKLFFRFHICCADGNNFIAVNNLAVFVNGKHSVGIAVKGKAGLKTVFGNNLLQCFNMG